MKKKFLRIVTVIIACLMLSASFTCLVGTAAEAELNIYMSASAAEGGTGLTKSSPILKLEELTALIKAQKDEGKIDENTTVIVNMSGVFCTIQDVFDASAHVHFQGMKKMVFQTTPGDSAKAEFLLGTGYFNFHVPSEFKNLVLGGFQPNDITDTSAQAWFTGGFSHNGHDMSFDEDCVFTCEHTNKKNGNLPRVTQAGYGTAAGFTPGDNAVITIKASGNLHELLFGTNFRQNDKTSNGTGNYKIVIDGNKALTINSLYIADNMNTCKQPSGFNGTAKLVLDNENATINSLYVSTNSSETSAGYYEHKGITDYEINAGTVKALYTTTNENDSVNQVHEGISVITINGGTVEKITKRGDDGTMRIVINNAGTVGTMADTGPDGAIYISQVKGGKLAADVSISDDGNYTATFNGFNVSEASAKQAVFTDSLGKTTVYAVENGKIAAKNLLPDIYTVEFTDNAAGDAGTQEEENVYFPSELMNTLYKIMTEKNVTVGYIGGSVTSGHGSTSSDSNSWRAISRDWFKTTFPTVKVTEINDSIGGTGMKFGLYRAQERYFAKNGGVAPDINFVEMAVNDKYDYLTGDLQYRYIESFIKKVYASNPKADIVFLITGDSSVATNELASDTPVFGKAYTDLAQYYNIPVVYVYRELLFDMKEENGGKAVTSTSDPIWQKYFIDIVHPTDEGYKHYATTLIEYLESQLPMTYTPTAEDYKDKVLPEKDYCQVNNKGELFLDATVVSPTKIENRDKLEGFRAYKLDSTWDEMYSSKIGNTVTLKFNSQDLYMWTYTNEKGAIVSYSIDGGEAKKLTIPTNHQRNVLAEGLAPGEHTVKITHTDATAGLSIRYFLMSGMNGEEAKLSVYDETVDAIVSTGILPNAEGGIAFAAEQAVKVDGKEVNFPMYQLRDDKGGTTNYIKLRDLAHIINGSAGQFNVGWDGTITLTSKTAYTSPNGTELKNPFTGDRAYAINTASIKVNGVEMKLNAFVLTDDAGGQYTYFQLRDLGQALGFNVGWKAEEGIFIETDKPYSHED